MRLVRLTLILTLVATMFATGAASAASSYAVPTSIDPTGSTDVTAQLNAFIAGVPDGSTITFPQEARYRIEGTVFVAGRRDLTFEGNGATFFALTDGSQAAPPKEDAVWYGRNWPRRRIHWLFSDGGGHVIRNMVVRGANPKGGATNAAFVAALEGQSGFEFASVDGALLEGCVVSDTYGDGVYIAVSSSGRWSSDVTVRGCRVERTGRQGVTVSAGEDITIERNEVRDIGRSAFDLEPAVDAWGARRVRIVENRVGLANGVFVAAYGRGSNVEDVDVVGNILSGEQVMVLVKAPEGARRRGVRVIGNVSDVRYGGPVAPLRFTRVDDVEVRGNYQAIAPERYSDGRLVYAGIAVSFTQGCGWVVEDNEFPGATREVTDDGWPCEQSGPAPSPAPTPSPSPAPSPAHGEAPHEAPRHEHGERVSRVAGTNRFHTAAQLSASTFAPGLERVYVATGQQFADALSAAAPAGRLDAPVLLTGRDVAPAATLSELRRLAPGQIVVVGGASSVGDKVVEQLSAVAPVRRVAGQDRYATAAAVALEAFARPLPVVYVASGEQFPDALGAGAAATSEGGALLLTAPNAVPAATAAALRELAPARVVVVGGRQAVGDEVIDMLRQVTGVTPTRLWGASRFDTSAAVARAVFKDTAASVYVASGRNFPDALVGGAAAGRRGAPLLIVEPSALPAPVATQLQRLAPQEVIVLGGEQAVHSSVFDAL